MKKPVQFGKYLLLDRINVGGMAEVFKAKAFGVEGFERLVAVKRILPNIAEDEEFITMFIDEAKIAVQLSHANICQIFDLGKVDDAFFIALEFVSGKDLRAIFDRCKAKPTAVNDSSPAMPLAQACFIIMKACEGLDYAHNKRDASGEELHLVHRDVSPQNILISFEGEVKLIDFGIAKAAGKASKTQQGILKGKFGYMSPEQVRGLPLDRRSDIFSVGICLYEMLTAERLFVGESDFSTLEKVRNVEILPPSTYNRRIPEELERICLKALAKDVEDRYQNAIDLHDDLQAFMYTAGEFYSRKDLGLWMKRIYDEEIKGEQSRVESYAKIPAIAPPPPPPPPVVPADRPIRRTATGIPAISVPPPPPAAATAGAGVPRLSGQHAAVAQLPAESSGLVTTPDSAPLAPSAEAPRNGKHQNGHANGKHKNGAHAADLNWDDEELATNIYDDKPEDAGDAVVSDSPARPDLSKVELALDGAPVPARAPTPARGVPESPIPTKLTYALPQAAISHTDLRARSRKTGPSTGAIAAAGITLLLVLAAGIGGYNYMATRPGQIVLTSDPSGAVQVLLDNQRVPVEGTPATILKPPGSYSLTVQREGYVPYSEQIELHSREVLKKNVALEPLTSGTGFALREPIGALVFLDGKQLDGQTPLQVQSVMPGKHKVEVRGQFGTWSEDISLEAGKVAELHPVFPPVQPVTPAPAPTPPPPPAHVSDSPLAPVRHPTRDEVPNMAPAPARPIARAPREPDAEPATPHERPVRAPAHKAAPLTNDADSDLATATPTPAPRAERAAAPPAAPAGEGYLRIGSQPWTSIFVDGKDTGLHTPQTHIKLSAGTHKIQLTNPQFNVRDTFSIDVGAGETQTVTKNYRPKEQQDDND
jgi:serine/threonine protein kinase